MEEEQKDKTKNKKITRIIIIALIAVTAIVGGILYSNSLKYETTDDAQLEAEIAPVTARTTGYIDRVYFKDNQQVKKGDTLVVLDDRELKIKVLQAEAALQNAMAGTNVASANATTTLYGSGTDAFKIDEIKIRLSNATKELDRYKKMFTSGSATQQQLDAMQTAKETLDKQLLSAQQQQRESTSKTGGANNQVVAARVLVKQKQAELDYAQLQLSYAAVLAPFNGTVSKKNAVAGQLIQAGQPLCSMVSDDNLWLVANFKETQVYKMKPGMKTYVDVDAFPGKSITGAVASFAPATGSRFSLIPPDNATGNYVKVVQRIPIVIDLDKNNDLFKLLKPGMSVDVKVEL